MLIRRFSLKAVAGTLTGILLLAGSASTAAASVGGTGSGGSCSDAGSTLSCGSGVTGTSGTGSGGGGSASSGNGGGGGATTVATPACPNYIPYSSEFPGQDGGPAPAGATQPGAWYFNTCSTGLATGQATGVVWLATGQAAPTLPPPDPAVAATQAESELQLPTPTLTLSPSTTGYVNLAEWYWIASSLWHPLSTTAQACNAGGCVSATATATPSFVTWSTGDGATLTCDGPGTPYDPTLPVSDQWTSCSHTYTTSSLGQPSPDGNPNDAAFPVTATITWSVSWAGPDESAGTLASLTTRGTTSLRVAQIESVNN